MSTYDQRRARPVVADGDPSTRLSDRLAAELQRMILAEELVFGERLPTEPELCRLFGVSRTVVREAVRSLASKGLLEVRQGGGTTVRFPDVAQASELLTIMLRSSGGDVFRLVHEVRTLLEVEIAGLAAERRTEADLAMLERRLQQTREPALDHAQWARADVELHQTIAFATHNPLHAVLLNSMAEMLMELRITAAQLEDTPRRANHHHERIAAAIRAADPRAARRAMREHMAEANETYRKARLSRAFDAV